MNWPGRWLGVWELRLGFCKGRWGRGCQEEERTRLWKSGPAGGGGRGREEERVGLAVKCTSGARKPDTDTSVGAQRTGSAQSYGWERPPSERPHAAGAVSALGTSAGLPDSREKIRGNCGHEGSGI